jgi:hypothetical protein
VLFVFLTYSITFLLVPRGYNLRVGDPQINTRRYVTNGPEVTESRLLSPIEVQACSFICEQLPGYFTELEGEWIHCLSIFRAFYVRCCQYGGPFLFFDICKRQQTDRSERQVWKLLRLTLVPSGRLYEVRVKYISNFLTGLMFWDLPLLLTRSVNFWRLYFCVLYFVFDSYSVRSGDSVSSETYFDTVYSVDLDEIIHS